jgi:hypothetical protein
VLLNAGMMAASVGERVFVTSSCKKEFDCEAPLQDRNNNR